MTVPAVLWPVLLGVCFLVAGVITYRRDVHVRPAREAFGLAALGPVFVAASLAAFAGEHFTAAGTLARLVPNWLPGHLFIAYFVGVAHLAAALSFVARRYVRWSAACLALMFALFVATLDLPAAIAHPAVQLSWILATREGTFAIGALALFAMATRAGRPERARAIAEFARIWTACVLAFYGIEHLLHPAYSPGVPSTVPTAPWVPVPHALTYATGILLVACGAAMFVRTSARSAAALCGLLMTLLTLGLYLPQLFVARGTAAQVTAINFIFDTLLFAGTVLVISRAVAAEWPKSGRELATA